MDAQIGFTFLGLWSGRINYGQAQNLADSLFFAFDFLAIESNQVSDNNYEMNLIFSGDAVIRVVAEVIEVTLDDQGEPWDTKNMPKHKVL